MVYKRIFAAIIGSCIATGGITAYADANDDENIIVGTCMIQKFRENKPSLKHSKIDECAKVEADAAPKCLGFTNEKYGSFVKFCIAQLDRDKCMSDKMKIPLIEYANCGYGKKSEACFKKLGYTKNAITKLTISCQKKNT